MSTQTSGMFAGLALAGANAAGPRTRQNVIFTDLDGTLLHARTYDYTAAAPGLELARRRGTPVVFCSSKTRPEVEHWRRETGNTDPFLVENGGAIYIPRGYFDFRLPCARVRDGYDAIELGSPYRVLVETLAAAAKESGCAVTGFGDLSVEEIASRTNLPFYQAQWAKRREFDEAFEIAGDKPERLLAAIRRRGKRCTQSGRFHHITGGHDKALAVQLLTAFYRRAMGPLRTVGLGDGPNDAGLLNSVDVPVLIGRQHVDAMRRRVPYFRATRAEGPRGWSEAVLQLL